MRRKRALLLGLTLLVAGPIAAVLAVPEWRERAHFKWMALKLRHGDRETRERVIQALLAKGRPDIDEVFPEVVAAAVANVASRSVLVGVKAQSMKPGERSITVFDDESYELDPMPATYVVVERELSVRPRYLLLGTTQVLFQSPLFELSNARSLFVAQDDGRLVVVVPLEGELGDQIVAAVEDRLARDRRAR